MREMSWNLGYGAYAVQSYYVTPNLGKWSHRCRGSRMTHAVVLQMLTTSKALTVVARVAGGISYSRSILILHLGYLSSGRLVGLCTRLASVAQVCDVVRSTNSSAEGALYDRN